MFEPVDIPVIGVGYIRPDAFDGLKEHSDVRSGVVRCLAFKGGKMTPVHGEDQVEPFKILRSDGAGTQVAYGIATCPGDSYGARIGRVSRMPVHDPAGIGVDPVFQSRIRYKAAEDTLGCRGAADVSGTDEKNMPGHDVPLSFG